MMDLVILFVLPFTWSLVVELMRRFAPDATAVPDDAREKRYLMILLAPVILGVGLVVLDHLAPRAIPHLPLSFMPVAPPPAPLAIAGQTPGLHRTTGFHFDILAWLPALAWAVYGLGLARAMMVLAMAVLRLRRIAATATPAHFAGHRVYLTDAALPPIAWGRDHILIPHGLVAQLSPVQLDLIVRHECAHIRRGDTLWFPAVSLIDAVFWFNPCVRRQTARCRAAAEIACDAAVTGALPQEREAYADLLVRVLKHAAGSPLPWAPAVFSTENQGDCRMRILQIMHLAGPQRKPRDRVLHAVLAMAFVPIVLAQVAWSQPLATVVPDGRAQLTSIGPDGPRAIADGVVANMARAEGVTLMDPAGKMTHGTWILSIDHGDDLVSTYTLLKASSLKIGDRVTKGQVVSDAGNFTELTTHCNFQASPGQAPTCGMSGGNGDTLKDGESVMWGNVTLVTLGHGNRTVHATIAFDDNARPNDTLRLKGDVSID